MLILEVHTAESARDLIDSLMKHSAKGLTIQVVAQVHDWAREVLLGKYERTASWSESDGVLQVTSLQRTSSGCFATHTIQAVNLSREKKVKGDVRIVLTQGLDGTTRSKLNGTYNPNAGWF